MNISDFWLGLLLAIPIGIFSNLITPRLQKLLDRFNHKRAIGRKTDLQKEYEKIKYFAENREAYREYLLVVVIKTTFISAFASCIITIYFAFSELTTFAIDSYNINDYFSPSRLRFIISYVVSLCSSLLIFNIASSALKIRSKVNNFVEYEKAVNQSLADQ